MDAVAGRAVTHRGVLEAEAWGAALGVVGVQVEVAQLAPTHHTDSVKSHTTLE